MSVVRQLAAQLGLDDLNPPPWVEWCRAWTVGDDVPADADATGRVVDQALSAALLSATISAGRDDPHSGIEATTCTVQLAHTIAGRIPAVGEPVRLAVGHQVAEALGLPASSRPRFTGEVTSRQVNDDDTLTIALVGRRARLGRIFLGDTPWPAESDGQRADRILQAAQVAYSALQLGTIDAGTVLVLPRDVDRQPALGLLDDLAADASAQLVEHRTGDLEWHDAEHRRNLSPAVELVAGQTVLAGLGWQSGIEGMVNDYTVSYGEAAEGENDQPTVRAVDELAAGPLGVGPIAATQSTQLVYESDAAELARLTVGRRSSETWDTPALVVDLMRSARHHLVALLGIEHGTLLRVTGLPSLSPFTTSRLFVEGYTESLSRHAWRMTLAVADASLAGVPARWADVPSTLTWADVPARYSWLTAARWQPTSDQVGRWADQPADLRWASVDPDLTWATYPTE